MSKPRTKEYKTFTQALGTVLTVSHDEMKQMLKREEEEKRKASLKELEQNLKQASSSARASDSKV